MKERLRMMRAFGAVAAAASLLLAGCCSLDKPAPKPAPAPAKVAAPAPVVVSTGCPVTGREGGNLFARRAIPTGVNASSVVMLETMAPETVNVGQEFEYSIKVTNLTDCELDDVVVTETLASGLAYKGSTPTATQAGSQLTWNLGTLAAKDSKVVKVKAVAGASGTFTDCARVAYREKLCRTVVAVEPKLVLKKAAPAEVLLCDVIPVKITVTNPGTGAATNVVITDDLPNGLKTVDGKTSVRIEVGTLAAGETKEYTINCQAAATGTYPNKAVAKADAGLSADAATSTVVKQPVLQIAKTATEMVYEGRPISYKVTVSNKGDAVSANTVLVDTLPAGATFVSATDGGQFANGVVTWNLGSMAPNASKEVGITATAAAQGTLVNRAEVKGTCAAAVAATAQTKVQGIPALLLEVIDVQDPIEVGANEVYVIDVTNQGTATATNVKITATLEDSQSFISATGVTAGSAAGQKVTFAPLPTLAPKAKAEWRVTVKAVKAGDVRFAVEMNADQLSRPVNETESTHQY